MISMDRQSHIHSNPDDGRSFKHEHRVPEGASHHDHEHGHSHDELLIGGDKLTSIGVDIGTATTHLMLSELQIGYRTVHSQRPEVLTRSVLAKSSVMLTPFDDKWRIDADTVGRFLKETYEAVGMGPESVDTGAVIITGEAARKENARQIAEFFSQQVGRFVCATAGPRLETIMAAHGSGAVERSREAAGALLNIDMGGGTTKISLIKNGKILGTTAVNVGARLVTYDPEGRIVRIETNGQRFLDDIGSRAKVGDRIESDLVDRLSARMAAVLFDVIHGKPAPWRELFVVPPMEVPSALDGIIFSGGVSEYVYGRETRGFGDLGMALGRHAIGQAGRRGHKRLVADEGIRATVIGASQHSVQVSGDTIFIPPAASLPLHSLRVFVVKVDWTLPIAERVCSAVRKALLERDQEVRGEPFALVFATPPFSGYGAVLELASGISRALGHLGAADRPHVLVFEQNIAGVVGSALAANLGVLCVDEVSLSEMDFIDIGARKPDERYVPIVVKSLVFDV